MEQVPLGFVRFSKDRYIIQLECGVFMLTEFAWAYE